MALKSDRHILYDDIRNFCNDVTERGVILVYSGSGGSGVNLDHPLALVTLPGTGSVSGLKPAGLLINDFVNVDQTRYRLNYHKDEMQVGQKAHLLKKGWVYTNKVSGTPGAGDVAYLASSGNVSPTQAAGAAQVGKFGGRKDSSGFVLLEVDLP